MAGIGGMFNSDSATSLNLQDSSGAGSQSNNRSNTANGESALASGRGSTVGTRYGDVNAAKDSTVNLTYGFDQDFVGQLQDKFLSSVATMSDGQAATAKTLTQKLSELLQQREEAKQQTDDKETPGLTTFQKTLLISAAAFLIYKLSR